MRRLAGPTLCACALLTSAHLTARESITVWGISIGPDSKGVQAVLRAFEARYPQYRVRVLAMGAGGMNPQKLMTSIVGRVPPDVIFQDRFTISDWASRGAFRPLDDLIARDAADPDTPRRDQYYAAAWNEASYKGRLYGIPYKADNRALYYNRALFRRKAAELRRAGLDPERPPRTWSELLAYSRALTERGLEASINVAGFLPNFGNAWLYLYAFQNDASFLSPDGLRCTINSPATVEALKFMREGYKIVGGYEAGARFSAGYAGSGTDAFMAGKLAMKIDGDWSIDELARYAPDLDFGVAPPPVPDDRFFRRGRFAGVKNTFISWSGGFCFGIPTGASNIEGGWRLIKFATSLSGRVIAARAQSEFMRRMGRVYVPALESHIGANKLVLREFMPSSPKLASALQVHMKLLSVSQIRPATPVGQMLWDAHVRAAEDVCLGLATPEEALAKAQATVQSELDAIARHDRLPLLNLGSAALIAAAVGGLGLLWLFLRVRAVKLGPIAANEARWGYAFVSPWLLGFVALTLGPMLASILFSFTEYNVLSPARWLGGGNYARMFGADWPNVSAAFSNALYLAAVGVPLGLFTGLAIALLLNSTGRGVRFFRTMFYMPSIVPTIASAVLWIWLLSPDPDKGLVNAVWRGTFGAWFGFEPPGWFTSPQWSKPGLVLMGLWGAGSGMLLWLAGLKGVPRQQYEAAELDGAGPSQQFWSVTFPALSPIFLFNAIIGVINVVQEFDRVYVSAAGTGGPGNSLLTPVLHLFMNGFFYFRMGYASALAWLIFAVILVLTLVQLRLSRRWVHYGAES